jgi:hypothetical protein
MRLNPAERRATDMHNATRAMALIGLSWLAAPTIAGSRLVQREDPVSASLQAAKTDLAERLGVAESDIGLVGIGEALTWPDASLGCPEPGEMYAQVLTHGFKLTLRARGRHYEYHTGEGAVRLCKNAAPPDGTKRDPGHR